MTNAHRRPRHLTRIADRFLLYRASGPIAQTDPSPTTCAPGLGGEQKHLSPKYFYDDLGSALFEAISHLPEYYLTRAETEIFESTPDEIVGALGEPSNSSNSAAAARRRRAC